MNVGANPPGHARTSKAGLLQAMGGLHTGEPWPHGCMPLVVIARFEEPPKRAGRNRQPYSHCELRVEMLNGRGFAPVWRDRASFCTGHSFHCAAGSEDTMQDRRARHTNIVGECLWLARHMFPGVDRVHVEARDLGRSPRITLQCSVDGSDEVDLEALRRNPYSTVQIIPRNAMERPMWAGTMCLLVMRMAVVRSHHWIQVPDAWTAGPRIRPKEALKAEVRSGRTGSDVYETLVSGRIANDVKHFLALRRCRKISTSELGHQDVILDADPTDS
nr:hypothetical protein CFP56_55010 [Quercus suber]